MKKMIFTLVAAIACATATFAQSSLVATLNHENTISVFTGQNALVDAMTAAVDGDLVTLSSGTFTASDLRKGVTLRGTGIAEDKVTGQYITRVQGQFYLNVPATATHQLTVEGINFTGTMRFSGRADNAVFNKCQFNQVNYAESVEYASNWKFTNCYITNGFSLADNVESSVTFLNSYVFNPTTGTQSKSGTMEFVNCIVQSGTIGFSSLYNGSFTNCIIYNNQSTGTKNLLDSNMAYNCIGYTNSETTSVFENINKASNTDLTTDQHNTLFKEGTFYELTDAAKSAYIGNDGTEVGLYGGVLPYTTRIMNPQITKCNVAKKTTTDGKLSVDIEVKAVTE